MAERDWRHDAVAAANAAGFKASLDETDAVLMAETRNLAAPGSQLDRLAEQLAADLEAKAPGLITRTTCAVLLRGACNVAGLSLLGYSASEVYTVLSVAAAKLEMRAAP